jgi:hypothetical protein
MGLGENLSSKISCQAPFNLFYMSGTSFHIKGLVSIFKENYKTTDTEENLLYPFPLMSILTNTFCNFIRLFFKKLGNDITYYLKFLIFT